MKTGWATKTLEQVCDELFAGGDVPKKNLSKFKTEKYRIPIFSNGAKNSGLYGYTDLIRVTKPSITVSARGTIGFSAIRNEPFFPVVRLIVLTPNTQTISLKFLKYVIGSLDFANSGSSIPQLTVPMIRKYAIPVPPLPEQKRIVAKLDRAFAAIDQAKANVERNLQNAKDLFQSKLNRIFSQKGDGWVEKKLSECIKLKSGDGLTAKNMNQEGLYPVYGGNGIAGNHDTYNSEGMQVIIGRVGALCGNVRYLNEKLWLTDNAFKVSKYYYAFDEAFLTYLLNYKNLRSYARQAAQPVISNSSTSDVPLEFPLDVEQQKSIVIHLDELKIQTQSMDTLYNQELDALSELKKSILQKAFNGELSD
ncbi:MAG: restriction endonuclease subunit S [SAR324 cluster bacterium]|nr:restriction endonuclease subunit S [SAR324 cluster bacterium]